MPAEPADVGRRAPRPQGLPPVWAPGRRRLLVLLVLSGLGQAIAAGLGAHALVRGFGVGPTSGATTLTLLLLAAAVVVGILTAVETVLGERLSQTYVHEIRLGLLRRQLSGTGSSGLGITIARTTNDLTSVRAWITHGIVPIAVGVPMLVGATVVLGRLSPWFVLSFLVPLALVGVALVALSPRAFERSKVLRRARGRLSSQVADTLIATDAIRSAGGARRELERIDRLGTDLADAAVSRSRITGSLRGAAAAASGLAMAVIVGTASVTGTPAATTFAAVSVIGFLAGPLHALGRVVEFRQTYRAARRVIAPAVAAPAVPVRAAVRADRPVGAHSDLPDVIASGIAVRQDQDAVMPVLTASAGDRVVVDVADPRAASVILAHFAALATSPSSDVLVRGVDVRTARPSVLRDLVGYAAQGMSLNRASIAKSVRYRTPEADDAQVAGLLERVGLAARVAELPSGDRTILRHGGDPLTIPERARLLLARAIADEPALLVIDRLDADLGLEGRVILRRLLADFRGVVLLASDIAALVAEPTHVWSANGLTVVSPSRAPAVPATR